jgi:hypothetical protein
VLHMLRCGAVHKPDSSRSGELALTRIFAS